MIVPSNSNLFVLVESGIFAEKHNLSPLRSIDTDAVQLDDESKEFVSTNKLLIE